MREDDQLQTDPADDAFAEEGPMGGGARPVTGFVSEAVTRLQPTMSLRDAATALQHDDVSLAVVGDEDSIEGVISERDLVRAVALGLDPDGHTVAEMESDSLRWAAATATVDDVAEEMLEAYVRHILVCNDDGTLAGVVSMRDLLTAYLV